MSDTDNLAARHRLIDALGATPAEFARAQSRLGDAFDTRPQPGEWSPLEVLHHVRASDLILSTRCWSALVRGAADHPGLDERRYAALLARAGRSPAEQIEAFRLRRAELLALVATLSEAEWSAPLSIDGAASTLETALRTLADHECEHTAQLRALIR